MQVLYPKLFTFPSMARKVMKNQGKFWVLRKVNENQEVSEKVRESQGKSRYLFL